MKLAKRKKRRQHQQKKLANQKINQQNTGNGELAKRTGKTEENWEKIGGQN